MVLPDADVEHVKPLDSNGTSQEECESTRESEDLVSFEQAARILGMGERNLRKIIQRTRERIQGRWTDGPTIRFFQAHPKAAIKFRRIWLDEFVCEHTFDPNLQTSRPLEPPRRPKKQQDKVGFGTYQRNNELELGFDSGFYNL